MSDKDRYTDRHARWFVRADVKQLQISVIAVTHSHAWIVTPWIYLYSLSLFNGMLLVLSIVTFYTSSPGDYLTYTQTKLFYRHSTSWDTEQMSFSVGQFFFLLSTWGSWESPLSAGSGCSRCSHASQAWWGGVARMGIFTPYCFPS